VPATSHAPSASAFIAARCEPWNTSVRKTVRGSTPSSASFTRGNTKPAALHGSTQPARVLPRPPMVLMRESLFTTSAAS